MKKGAIPHMPGYGHCPGRAVPLPLARGGAAVTWGAAKVSLNQTLRSLREQLIFQRQAPDMADVMTSGIARRFPAVFKP